MENVNSAKVSIRVVCVRTLGYSLSVCAKFCSKKIKTITEVIYT